MISSAFPGISSSFTILSSFDLVPASPVLFLKNSPALWTTFLEVVFKESSPVFSNYFLANDKNPYLLTYFLVLASVAYRRITKLEKLCHFHLLIRNVKLTLSSISRGPRF